MRIVVTHANMDFDALACQYGVTKLYPGTRMILGYPLYGNVRNFLALYRDSLPISQIKYLDLKQIEHVYIVDCQRIERLDDNVKKLLGPEYRVPFTIFDHHISDETSLCHYPNANPIIKPFGSATSIVVDEIIKHKITLTPFDATLLNIGIYEDTGCLTYRSTTYNDAICVAHLLKNGSDLTQVNDFTAFKLSPEQIELFHEIMSKIEIFFIKGLKIVIVIGQKECFLEGLASLTRKILEIEAADACFIVYKMKDRTHLVARSDNRGIDAANILKHFGGAGHPGAASAVEKNKDLSTIKQELLKLLEMNVLGELKAYQIMTTKFKLISTDTTMQEAKRLMLRYNEQGLIVASGKQLEGIVTRRDIDQAIHHKLEHARVLGFMSKPLITVNANNSFREIQQKMVNHDIGRLPVIDENSNLIGLITRHDIINTLYEKSHDESSANDIMNRAIDQEDKAILDISNKLANYHISLKWLIAELGIIASLLDMKIYLVGGCVRDLLLNLDNYDFDFVIEGQAVFFAQELARLYPGRFELIAVHERFKTATVLFKAQKNYTIDFSTARIEFYEYPSALPQVEESKLKHDLFRRDFSINALAVCLNPGHFGLLIDYFNSNQDIKNKELRILHPFSFIEDPTRIIRMVRFAIRLNFSIETKTFEQAKRAILIGVLNDISGSRFAQELKEIFENQAKLIESLDIMYSFTNDFTFLAPEVVYDKQMKYKLRLARKLIHYFKINDVFIIYLGVLLKDSSLYNINQVLKKLMIPYRQRIMLVKAVQILQDNTNLSQHPNKAQIYDIFNGLSDESLIIIACCCENNSILRKILHEYIMNIRKINIFFTGQDLLKLGFKQGKSIGDILYKILVAKINGLIDDTYQSEKEFVLNNFS